MSQYLHHNDFGCISRCRTGCCLHLYFGNVALCLKTAEAADWCTTTARLYEQQVAVLPDATTRAITLPGPVSCQAFVFNLEELFMLHDLLMGAALLLEAEAILAGSPLQ